MRERSPPLCLLSLSPFQRIFADSSLLDILYSMLLLISFDFECKSFRFSVHGASLCSVACALSTRGLSLVIWLWVRIFRPSTTEHPSVRWPVLCPLGGLVLPLSLGMRFRKLHRKSNCSEATSSLAANAAASFADILAADSDPAMPTDDKDVRAALVSFGAVFNKRKGDANAVVRADPNLSPVFSRPFRTTSCPPST